MPRRAKFRSEILLAFGIALVFTALTAIGPTSFFHGYDYVRMHELYRAFFRDTILSGNFPWWNPHVALGRPFAADIEAAVFYPPTWLVVPFGTTAGVIIAVTLHATLAALGGFRCARRLGVESRLAAWTAALALLFGGALHARHMTGQLQFVFALCWLPFVLERALAAQESVTRQNVAWGAIVYGLFVLAGSPPVLWIGTLAVIVLVVARAATLRQAGRGVAATAAMVAVGACAAGIILVPFGELVLEGNRPVQAAAAALALPMTSSGWQSLVLPPSGTWSVNQEFDLYVGLPLALAALASLRWVRNANVRGLVVTAAVFALLASSPFAAVRLFLVEHVPGMASLRVPARYALVASWSVALLGAFALSRNQHRKTLVASVAVLEAAALLVGAWQRNTVLHPSDTFPGEASLRTAVMPWRDEKAPVRVSYSWFHVRANYAMAAGVSTYQSFANPVLARVWNALHAMRHQPVPQLDLVMLYPAISGPEPFPFAAMNLRVGEVNLSGEFVSRDDPDPRAYVAFQSQPARSWRDALTAMSRGSTDFVARPIVENDALVFDAPTARPLVPATITAFSNHSLSLAVDAPVAGLLVVKEAWYPGWRARINGQDADVAPANVWMRAVRVPAGPCTVQMYYSPRVFLLGAALSLCGWCLVGSLLRQRTRRVADA